MIWDLRFGVVLFCLQGSNSNGTPHAVRSQSAEAKANLNMKVQKLFMRIFLLFVQIAFGKNVAMTLPRRFYLPRTSHSDLPVPMTYFPFLFSFAVKQRSSDTSFRPLFCILSAFFGLYPGSWFIPDTSRETTKGTNCLIVLPGISLFSVEWNIWILFFVVSVRNRLANIWRIRRRF